MERWQLKQLQELPLEIKIAKTKQRIKEWYEYFNGEVYVSFSGGKDSTVLLHLVRKIYPEIEGVFVDTGLEYPEIREFVKTIDNIKWIHPKLNFKDILNKYGYPVVSKEQSQYISEYKNTKSEKLKNTRLNGNKWGMGKISKKWLYLLDVPFKISDKCCKYMKKEPIYKYEKETNKKPYIGNLAEESFMRTQMYLQQDGCNSFNTKRMTSKPLGFWTEQDILVYIKTYNIPYSKIYGTIAEKEEKLYLTGAQRTGCMFCMFGIHLDDEPNRFQRMKLTHPKLYDYCINKLECGKVLDYMNIKYK